MPKRILQGVVVGDKADKTISVVIERRVNHPVYGKIVRVSKKYAAHDKDNKFKIGDTVRIIECKPYSKSKKWEVIYDQAA